MKPRVARTLYSTASYLLTPIALARLAIKSGSNAAYRSHMAERFGFVSSPDRKQKHLHFHAVSVGETLAAAPMIHRLRKAHPDWSFSVSVTTPTGRDQAVKHLGIIANISFLPFDTPDAISRFLKRISPDLLVMVETELWPNLTSQCHKKGIPTLLMNGRMSEKSASRYQQMSWLSRPMLSQIDLVLAQFDTDAKRFVQLGCLPDRVISSGSVKFDVALTEDMKNLSAQLKHSWGLESRQVWIAASTHPGEEELLLTVHQRLLGLYPGLLLILVPRHPERAQELEQAAATKGLSSALRTAVEAEAPIVEQVLLVDTLGELMSFYGLSNIAFVGGSLIPHGGHNPIEPALWSLPILTGTHCHNFSEITAQLVEQGSLVQCAEIESLHLQMELLLKDSELRLSRGRKSSAVLSNNQGALQRQQLEIENLLNRSQF